MGFTGRTEHRFDIGNGEFGRHRSSASGGGLAANDFHHGDTAGKGDVLFVAQRAHQETL